MKNLTLIILLFSLASCQFELPEEAFDESAAAVPMDELNVPVGFDFGTARNVRMEVTAKDAQGGVLRNVPFTIFVPDGGSLLEIQTASTGAEGKAILEVNLPMAVGEVVVKTPYLGLPAEKLIQIGTSTLIEVILGEENRDGYVGGDENAQYLVNNSSNEASSQVAATGAVATRANIEFAYLGSYNSLGKPDYLVTPNDVVPQDLLDVINASLPEGQPVPTYNPGYLASDRVSTIELIEDAQVWVTFVHEGAGYRNALGYYSYSTDDPPATVDDIEDFNIIFPNVSFNGSGGQLATGNKVYLGTFEAGTSVGWFLVPNGWNGTTGQVDVKPSIKFSDKSLNTFTLEQYRQHTALLYDQSLQKLILGMEDIDRPGGDNDFNDAIFYVTANPFTAVRTENLVAAKNTDDDDDDGVSNSVDVEPNNPNIAFHAYTPAQGAFGTLAFEDLYPSQGDYDLNDLVVDYNFKEVLNANNQIVRIEATLRLMAAGSVQENGFGFELGVLPDKVASVSGHQVSNAIELLGQNNVEYKQDKAVIIAFDKSLTLLGGGRLINTENNETGVDPVELKLTINLAQPISREELGTAPYNPFMFVSDLRGKEVHLPGKPPTNRATAGFFGAADDATDPSAGIFYVTKTGLPYAIHIPVSFAYPMERVPVNTAHLKFSNWVQSGGAQFADWYKNLNGYRAGNKLYNK